MSYYLFEYLNLNPLSRQDRKARKLFFAQIQSLEEIELHSLLKITINNNYFKICSRPKLVKTLNKIWKSRGNLDPVFDIKVDTQMNDLLLKILPENTLNQRLSNLIDHIESLKGKDSKKQVEDIFNIISSLPYNQRKLFTSLISGTHNPSGILFMLEELISSKYNINKKAIKYFIKYFPEKIFNSNWEDIIELIKSTDDRMLPQYSIQPISDKLKLKFRYNYLFQVHFVILEIINSNEQRIIWTSDGELHIDTLGIFNSAIDNLPEGNTLVVYDKEKNEGHVLSHNGLYAESSIDLVSILESGLMNLKLAARIKDKPPVQGSFSLKTDDHSTFFKDEGQIESFYFPLLYVKGRRNIESIVLGIYRDKAVVPFCEFDISDMDKDFVETLEVLANQLTTERFGPVRQLSITKAIRCTCSALRVNNRKKSGYIPEHAVLIQDIQSLEDVQCPDLESLLSALPVVGNLN